MELMDLSRLLAENSYPGRGIVIGKTPDGKKAAVAYFIMGRSQNSRNRVFEETPDGIRTRAFDPSKMEDPSLIIYHPVRRLGGWTVVTNGDQTDTVRDALAAGGSFEDALRTRTFEPDGPNWTPRISGLVALGEGDFSVKLSILKSADGNGEYAQRYFFDYPRLPAGEGRFLHTYRGDGSPIPSFEGEPERVAVAAPSAEAWARELWGSLNEDNKVSLYVEYLSLEDGDREAVILNKNA